MSVPPSDALLRSLEADLVHVHRARMAERQGRLMAQLRLERAKDVPDAHVIAMIKAALVQTERDKQDVSITEREVLAPLRESLRRQNSASSRSSAAPGASPG